MTEYTLNVIAILEKMKAELGSAPLAYWVTPNTILTLSGLRAYCDGVLWGNSRGQLEGWLGEVEQSFTVLGRHIQVFSSDIGIQTARKEEDYTSYEIVFRPGLEKVLHETTLLTDPQSLLDGERSTLALLAAMRQQVSQHPACRTMDDEDLNHVAFGILVGYPDKAIIGYVKDIDPRKDPFAEQSIPADIRGAGYYQCPQPYYSYPLHMVTDPDITAHEQLWTSVLREYYHSDFHKELEADEAYKTKLVELDMLWED